MLLFPKVLTFIILFSEYYIATYNTLSVHDDDDDDMIIMMIATYEKSI